jgi:outer membrane protein TolC
VPNEVGPRGDLQAADLRADAAQAGVRAQRGAWLPVIEANWAGTWSQNPGFQPEATFWTAGVQARWSLWDGGTRIARTRGQAVSAQQARIVADAARSDAQGEQRTARQELLAAGADTQAAAARQALADEALRLREDALASGYGSQEDALDAALVADQAALGVLAAMAREAQAVARMRVVSGL